MSSTSVTQLLGASIKGFKKSMSGDDNVATKSSDKYFQNSDFTPPPVAPKVGQNS